MKIEYPLSMAKKEPIWKRETLTKKEKALAEAFIVLLAIYAAVALPITFGKIIESTMNPGIFTELYKQLEIIQHNSSWVATGGGFVMIETYLDRPIKRILNKIDSEKIEELKQKWIPLISAALIGIFHWYAESGIAGDGMGTPDVLDAVYGILAIFPIYIILEYARKYETSK